MKICLLVPALVLLATSINAQHSLEILPRYMNESEKQKMQNYSFPLLEKGTETPPPFDNLRTMAEWEEIQALTITWQGFPGILKRITRAAAEETTVIIFSENPSDTQSYLLSNAAGGPLNSLENVQIVDAESNSIWMRDYGANTVYGNRVDTLVLVDWIYNRPRPDDDVIPEVLADELGLELYTTTAAPNDLVNTGGNFMSDGQGNGFASALILEENEPANPYNVTAKSEEEIDDIMSAFQGIDPYIKMAPLPYDIINHIDMHMKLLDEKTLLVGFYPEGIADGPQINANIDYVVNNFTNTFGENFEVVRIPMPNSPSGLWPDDNPAGYYRTYTNGVFVNKTFIYPSYREEYDTTAARIYQELLPGYTLVPIDCDNPGENIISLAGAIHCITHSVGVNEPLLIVHNSLNDTEDTSNPYEVVAAIEHKTGIASATLHWRLEGEENFNLVEMGEVETNDWSGLIPSQEVGAIIEYYVSAVAENGKTQVRPIVAPDGFWSFEVQGTVTSTEFEELVVLSEVYPNPATDLVSIPVFTERNLETVIYLADIAGKLVKQVYAGKINGDRRISLFVSDLNTGVYQVVVEGEFGRKATPLLVR
ncbi:MAG: agmatine deiminase family protein [Flavobacteriales bacterium]|nr:agmatine deiminase family protein [Flavobacteriales bacterium]